MDDEIFKITPEKELKMKHRERRKKIQILTFDTGRPRICLETRNGGKKQIEKLQFVCKRIIKTMFEEM